MHFVVARRTAKGRRKREQSMRIIQLITAAYAAALSFAPASLAGSSDFVFEATDKTIVQGAEAVISVRLKHRRTGAPVTDAVIVRARIDMAPDGMAEMDAPLSLLPAPEPGVYSFKTELPMAGRWLLSIAAKVQGEAETVVGKMTLKVAE
jgi:hypothetical protein